MIVENAWLRPAVIDDRPAAAFMTLINNSDRTIRVARISSPQFGRVEMHETRMTDGMMRMRPLTALEVPAHGRLTLASGGMHLMLHEPSGAIDSLTMIDLSLYDSAGLITELRLQVANENPYE